MDERPTPPPPSPEDYGAPEAIEAVEAPETNGEAFDAIAEFTVPIEPQRRFKGVWANDMKPVLTRRDPCGAARASRPRA